MKKIIFTDLDGTLLDRETYSWEAARPALERLQQRDVPLIFVTSKTRAEVEWWRTQMGNKDPFIVENGAAAYIPHDYFSFRIEHVPRRGDYEVLEWGTTYKNLVSRLNEAAQRSRCQVRGFNDMTTAEVAFTCGLSTEQAALAKLREYDEPFRILDAGRADQLLAAIEKQGLRWTKGGRFWHITGNNDKAVAVTAVQELFEREYGPLATIGLGDAVNDAPFLKVVDVPVIVRSHESAGLKAAVPRGVVTDEPGPAGWNKIVLKIVP
jgi:mannosyl-3-phosphoglycerate phosphatase